MKRKLSYIYTFISSYFLSCTLILMKEINFNIEKMPINFINNFRFNISFFIKTILISIPIFIIFNLIFYLLDKIKIKEEEKVHSLKIFIISFICIFISGLLFLITYYPGSAMTDTFDILTTPIGVANKNPLLYNLIIAVPYRLFYKILNNMNLSFFLVSLIQLIINSFILSLIIKWFYNTFKNKITTILIILYFTLLPIIANYNTAIVKDSLFNIVILIYLPLLYNLIVSKGKWLEKKTNLILTIILLVFTTLIRSNGLYIVLFILLLLFINYKKYYKKWLLSLIIVILCNSSLKLLTFIDKPLFQEKIAIPLQQVAYVIKTNGKIEKSDKEYLNQIFSIDNFKDKYNPYIVDNIKWDQDFNRLYLNETKGKFIKTYLKILPNNFSRYVKSYLLTTYGTYAFTGFIEGQSRFLGFSGFDLSLYSDFKEMHNQRLLPSNMQNSLENFYQKTTIYFNNGTCFWLLIVLILYIVHSNKNKYLLLTSPLIAIWITLMIASPLSTSFRYMSSFMYMLPFIYLIVLPKKKEAIAKLSD